MTLETKISPAQSTETTNQSPAGCCGGAAPKGTDACCALDAEVKSNGATGCGCGPTAPIEKKRCC